MKQVLMIDPAANGKYVSSSSYNNGLVDALSSKVDITLAATVDYEKNNRRIKVINCFFKYSNRLKRSKTRSIIRLIEYIWAYIRIIKDVYKNNYDAIHYQWMLCYPIDYFFLNIMKKRCKKIVYTAHNVLPHIAGTKKYNELKRIYEKVDIIIVHGNSIKEEFLKYYPELIDKVKIEYHGEYYHMSTRYNAELIPEWLETTIKHYDKIVLFSGNIFFNKGIDMLVNVWIKYFKETNNLLIITGEQSTKYPEYDKLNHTIENCRNIIRFTQYVDSELFNYIASSCDIMILPYRHASMSAVVFTAACFKKTILTTDVGSIKEYLEVGKDSFLCEPTEDSLYISLKHIFDNYNKKQLQYMGEKLSFDIHSKYSWSKIAEDMCTNIY